MFSPVDTKLIELVSRNYYKVKINEDNNFDEDNFVYNEATNEEMIRYIINHRHIENSKEEKIINSIID